jgi:dTDP-4-dehydrorhamnose reductase
LKILITGSTGQLGKALLRQAKESIESVIGLTHRQLDITDNTRLEKVFADRQPAVAINAAAYTDVDRSEQEPQKAFAVNARGPSYLAACCAKYDIPLVHISTDYVFDGIKNSPYKETDPIAPLGIYGQSKADGEHAVRTICQRHIIIRTAWLYGVDGRNFVKTMLRLGRVKESLRVVADQHGSPTCADDLAAAICVIVHRIRHKENIRWGTYHFNGQGVTTWYEFADTIFDYARRIGNMRLQRLEPITTAEYPTPARRPPYSVLDCTQIQANFGIAPTPWRQSLKQTVERLMGQRFGSPGL